MPLSLYLSLNSTRFLFNDAFCGQWRTYENVENLILTPILIKCHSTCFFLALVIILTSTLDISSTLQIFDEPFRHARDLNNFQNVRNEQQSTLIDKSYVKKFKFLIIIPTMVESIENYVKRRNFQRQIANYFDIKWQRRGNMHENDNRQQE